MSGLFRGDDDPDRDIVTSDFFVSSEDRSVLRSIQVELENDSVGGIE